MAATNSVLHNPAAPQLPTQAGAVADCVSWIQALSKDDTCLWFADRAGIQLEDLYHYNPILGWGGENCPEQFLPNYWYCVGTSSASGASNIEVLTVIPSNAAPAVENSDPASTSTTTTATVTSSIQNPESFNNPDDEPNVQNIITALLPAPTPRDLPQTTMTATNPRTRVSTITLEPVVGRRDDTDAGDAESGEESSNEEDDEEGVEEELGKREEQPTVTKIVTLVRRNRMMGRYQE